MRARLLALERTSPLRRISTSGLPCGRSPLRRGLFDRHHLRKRVGRSTSATRPTTRPQPARLGFILDSCSWKCCLLDTGSQVSLWPASPLSPNLPSSLRLSATNGTPIQAFGHARKQIKLGGISYSFVFILAQVPRPILGLDFLQTFQMTIDLCKRRLLHSGTSTRFSSASSSVSGINIMHAPSCFSRLLHEFPKITDASLASSTSRHGVKCFINTSGPPIKTSPRRLTPAKLPTAKQYFDLMFAAGICRRSGSPWSLGLHMVAKKDGSVRPCWDYRRLNERTSGDAYPIPHIHDFATGLSGCRVFSKINLVKGYHQVPLHAEDVSKTAITTPFGLFKFVRMPFGLKNVMQTFQRLMDNVTNQLMGVFAYLDDVLVASPSAAQHERDLQQLFDALRRFGLVVNKMCLACPNCTSSATTSPLRASGLYPKKSTPYAISSGRAP